MEGKRAGGAGAAVYSSLYLEARLCDRGFRRVGEGIELGDGLIAAAARRADQGRPAAFAEVQLEVGVGKRREAIEGGDQLARFGIGLYLARLLYEDASFLGSGDYVYGEEGAARVLVGLRQVQRAFDRFFQEGRVRDEASELRGFRAALSGFGVDLLAFFVLVFRADAEAFGGRRVGGDALREGHFDLVGLGFGHGAGAEQALVWQLQFEVETGAVLGEL